MRPRIASRDWELLSAHIDGQLAGQDLARLQARLQSEPDLAEALAGLQQTRAMLRAIPRRKVPHNFTLTHEMVARTAPLGRRISSWFSVLSFSSALATLLLVVTAFLRLSGPLNAPVIAMEQQSAAAPEMAAGAASDAFALTPTVPIIIWQGGATGMGGGGGGGGAEGPVTMAMPQEDVLKAMEEPLPEMAAPEESTGAAEGVEPQATPTAAERTLPNQNDPGPTPEPTLSLLDPTPLPPLEGTGPIVGVAPPEEQGSYTVSTTTPAEGPTGEESGGDNASTSTTSAPEPSGPLLGWLQAGLALLALASGLGAYWLWRKSR